MGYKAFDPGMICNGKQYAENTVFEEAGAYGCCQAGVMHFAASGDESQLAASGANSIAAAIGKGSVASAALGSWIVLAEYDEHNNPLCVRAAQIDGKKLKPNVFYRLVDGELVEVK